jgi:hypothetical protein
MLNNSEQIVQQQIARHHAGFVEMEIVESFYGFSVRYASGLNDFAIIRPARWSKDPSHEAAVAFCEAWAANDPKHRIWTDRTA